MSLHDVILSDWKSAVKARDSAKALALSNIKAVLLNKAIELGARQAGLTDEQAISVLQKLQKQSEDTISSLPEASALKEKERMELSIISSYLPKRLSSDEVREKVCSLLAGSNVKDLGAGMKLCLPSLRSVADGKQIQQLVRQYLEENNK